MDENVVEEEDFLANWAAPIMLDFYNGEEYQQIQTTQGHLYSFLWKGDPSIFSLSTTLPFPQNASGLLKILRISQNQDKPYYRSEYKDRLADVAIRHALQNISDHIHQLNMPEGFGANLFLYHFDYLDGVSCGKLEKASIALKQSFSTEVQAYSLKDLGVPDFDVYLPTTKIGVSLIPGDTSEEQLADLMKPIFYTPNPKISPKQQRFKLNLHGIFKEATPKATKVYVLKGYSPTNAAEETVTFFVEGSAEEPYQVKFQRSGTNLTAHCTCPAGSKRQYCKHRLNILLGQPVNIVSQNRALADDVATWLEGSDVGIAIQELRKEERRLGATKETIMGYKKKLARALMD
ncbi:MAG: hypothetical protein H0X47_06430 [Nitrospirales bacterium]|nr:hypothetical protein [Nitrospirales bacterium]